LTPAVGVYFTGFRRLMQPVAACHHSLCSPSSYHLLSSPSSFLICASTTFNHYFSQMTPTTIIPDSQPQTFILNHAVEMLTPREEKTVVITVRGPFYGEGMPCRSRYSSQPDPPFLLVLYRGRGLSHRRANGRSDVPSSSCSDMSPEGRSLRRARRSQTVEHSPQLMPASP
jgi:hypothetical protein